MQVYLRNFRGFCKQFQTCFDHSNVYFLKNYKPQKFKVQLMNPLSVKKRSFWLIQKIYFVVIDPSITFCNIEIKSKVYLEFILNLFIRAHMTFMVILNETGQSFWQEVHTIKIYQKTKKKVTSSLQLVNHE